MAEHTADTEQFPWSQHAPLTYRRFQLRNNVLLGTKNVVPNPFLVWSFYCSLYYSARTNDNFIRSIARHIGAVRVGHIAVCTLMRY